MTAKLIDGTAIGADVRREVTEEVAALKAQSGLVPNLAVVLVGDNPGSQSYVSSRARPAGKPAWDSVTHRLPATATQAEVENLVRVAERRPAGQRHPGAVATSQRIG